MESRNQSWDESRNERCYERCNERWNGVPDSRREVYMQSAAHQDGAVFKDNIYWSWLSVTGILSDV